MSAYNKINQVERMKDLISFKRNTTTYEKINPIIESTLKANDGKTYGIIKENSKFYLKVAPEKSSELLAEDFDYIGGLSNKTNYEYNSYNVASKQLELKVKSVNESLYKPEVIVKPKQNKEWQTKETFEMREGINRFKEIVHNVNVIMNEDCGAIMCDDSNNPYVKGNPTKEEENQPYIIDTEYNGDKLRWYEKEDHTDVEPYRDEIKYNGDKLTWYTKEEHTDVEPYTEKPCPKFIKLSSDQVNRLYEKEIDINDVDGLGNNFIEESCIIENDITDEDFDDLEMELCGEVIEESKNEFGKHPRYGKPLMDIDIVEPKKRYGRNWGDKSDKSNKPYGNRLDKASEPYIDLLVDTITESIYETLKKKV